MIKVHGLTVMECQVIEAIAQGDYYDDEPCECVGNLVDTTGIPAKKLRGVLASLIQKGYIQEVELPSKVKAYKNL